MSPFGIDLIKNIDHLQSDGYQNHADFHVYRRFCTFVSFSVVASSMLARYKALTDRQGTLLLHGKWNSVNKIKKFIHRT